MASRETPKSMMDVCALKGATEVRSTYNDRKPGNVASIGSNANAAAPKAATYSEMLLQEVWNRNSIIAIYWISRKRYCVII